MTTISLAKANPNLIVTFVRTMILDPVRESLSKGPPRTFISKTEEALAGLSSAKLDDERVHTVRKALKSARAALRFLRPRLGEKAYERENVAFRDAARELVPLRDARTLLASLDLLDKQRHKVVKEALARLRLSLIERLQQARADFATNRSALLHCGELVRTSRDRVCDALDSQGDEVESLDAFERIYRKARKAYVQA